MPEGLQAEATDALENLRDLARGIYPPLLADKGLAEALTAQARKASIPVHVESDGIGRYPQEIESALYFCCLEALQNVAKYANATRVDVGCPRAPTSSRSRCATTGRASTRARRGGGAACRARPTVTGRVPVRDQEREAR